MSSNGRADRDTNPSIFLRLRGGATTARELAWHEFHECYAPVIAAFARELGAKAHQVDELVQDVLVGFYARSPTFVYDPAKGRFRSYLRTCTCHVVRRRKRVPGALADPTSDVTHRSQSVEQFETDDERELLAGEGVDERLEHRREPRRLQAAEPIGQFSQPAIATRHSVPPGEIDVQSEQPIDDRPDVASLRRRVE